MLQCSVGIGPCLAPTNLLSTDDYFLPLTSHYCFFCIPSLLSPDTLPIFLPTYKTSLTFPIHLSYFFSYHLPCQRYSTSASSPLLKTLIAPHLIYIPKIVRSEKSTLYFTRQRVHRTRLQAFRRLATRTTSFSVISLSSGAWRTRRDQDWQA